MCEAFEGCFKFIMRLMLFYMSLYDSNGVAIRIKAYWIQPDYCQFPFVSSSSFPPIFYFWRYNPWFPMLRNWNNILFVSFEYWLNKLKTVKITKMCKLMQRFTTRCMVEPIKFFVLQCACILQDRDSAALKDAGIIGGGLTYYTWCNLLPIYFCC